MTDLSRAMPALASMPTTAATGLTDVALTALQRTFTLHVGLADGLVGLAVAQSRRAFSDPTGALRDAMLSPAAAEPTWRWAAGLAAVTQSAAASMVSLMAAQARGSTRELESLCRDAKDAAARSAADAASAANVAMTHGLDAIGQLAGSATQAALRSATEDTIRAATDVALRTSDVAARSAGAAMDAVEDITHAMEHPGTHEAGEGEDEGRDTGHAPSRRGGHAGSRSANGPGARPSARGRPASKSSRPTRNAANRGESPARPAAANAPSRKGGAGGQRRGSRGRG